MFFYLSMFLIIKKTSWSLCRILSFIMLYINLQSVAVMFLQQGV